MHAGRGPACREDKRGVAADKGILGVCVRARVRAGARARARERGMCAYPGDVDSDTSPARADDEATQPHSDT